MILEILIFIISTIICYYMYSYKKLHKYFKDRGVKYLPGVPLFGNVLRSTFLKKHFLYELDEIYNAFPDEKYVGLFELTTPILLIRDPEIIKNIVVKDFDHFTDHKEFFSKDADPLLGQSLFLMKGERWRDMRTTLSPAFTSTKMKCMIPFIVDNTMNIIDYLNEHVKQDIDVDDLMRRYTNDVIASAGFGLEVNSLKDKDNDFYRIGSDLFSYNARQRLFLVLYGQFPELTKKLGMRLFSDETYSFFTNVVRDTIEYRKKENIKRPDMIHMLMESKKEWTIEDLVGQVFVFFTAGFDSPAATLVMSIHEMALNPNVQEKLYQECRKFKKEKDFTFDNLAELKYLDGLINETLRKWSPGVIFDRTCTKSYELPPPREGGQPYVVKPGDIIYNAVNQIQMDAKYWPETQKFDPDRFSDENKTTIIPGTYIPFGVGPRICMGVKFAMMELKVLLYHLVLNFKILKTEKTKDPIELLPHWFVLKCIGGTIVQFEKRMS